MTTTTANQLPADAPSRTPLLVALGVGASSLLTAMGTFLDLTGNEPAGQATSEQLREWLVITGIAAVTAAIVFGFVVRTAARGNAARRSLVLSVLAAPSIAVFWTGIPSVLAAAAIGCALVDRDSRGAFSGAAKAGLVLGAIAVAGAIVTAIAG